MNARRLRLELQPSPLLAVAIVALHAGAAASALVALPGTAGALIGAGLLALGALAAWRGALLRSASSVRVLELEGAALNVTLAGGQAGLGEVAPRRYVSRLVVTLALRAPVRRTLLITRDMLDADSFRALRVWALWGRLPAVAAKQLPAWPAAPARVELFHCACVCGT
ncbi:MAG TPA: protein YgfX [Burkholderiales bacterium]|nr:protein YgfX [Burkholderiales bacterium]